MSTEQDIREKLKDIRVGYLIDESQWTFNTDELVNMILSHGNQRELEGASKAAIAINGELGLDLTANGHYYIDRFERLHKQKQEKP